MPHPTEPPLTAGTPASVGDRAALRAECRQLRESLRAQLTLLKARKPFELAEHKRVNRDETDRARAQRIHDRAVARSAAGMRRTQARAERQLAGLDGDRERAEKQALATLRRDHIDAAMRRSYLNAKELNGLATVLINDLAARGIRTAADFRRISLGPAPGGRGTSVHWIHTTSGGKVHVNGIGEHRAKELIAWRDFCLRRAEAGAPTRMPPDERHRLAETIERRRTELRAQHRDALKSDEAARESARTALDHSLDQIGRAALAADSSAARRRAEFDAMAESVRSLEERISDLEGEAGGFGLRLRGLVPAPRRSTSYAVGEGGRRVAAPEPAAARTATGAGLPEPTTPPAAGTPAAPPGWFWLFPVLLFAGSLSVGGGGVSKAAAPPWIWYAVQAGHVSMIGYLLTAFVRRRRLARRTGAGMPMPAGTKRLVAGWLLAVAGVGSAYDQHSGSDGSIASRVAGACAVILLCSALFAGADERAGQS
ncbi:hypothetical protein ACFVYE_07940 [Streptomyces sp. NPDC058239]|uniref:hypothetical protein n=1 Tax=Streptomyces sp. NPDC058239 TaxID=3346395 RepID=UPI0036EF9C6E